MEDEYKDNFTPESDNAKQQNIGLGNEDEVMRKKILLHEMFTVQIQTIANQDYNAFEKTTKDISKFDITGITGISDVFESSSIINHIFGLYSSTEDFNLINLCNITLMFILKCHPAAVFDFPKPELVEKMGQTLQQPYNPASLSTIQLLNIMIDADKNDSNFYFGAIPPEVIQNFSTLFNIRNRKNFYSLPHDLSIEFAKFLSNICENDLTPEQSNIIIDLLGFVIEGEYGGTDIAIKAACKLIRKNLFTLYEFFQHDFHNYIAKVIRVATYEEMMAVCELLKCLMDVGWKCKDFPVEDVLDAFDRIESTTCRDEIFQVFNQMIQVCEYETFHNLLETGILLVIAKQIKYIENENICTKEKYQVKKDFASIFPATMLLIEFYKKMTNDDIFYFTNQTVAIALVEIIKSFDDYDAQIDILRVILRCLEAFQVYGQVFELLHILYEQDFSEAMIALVQDEDDEEIIELNNRILDFIPE